MEAEESVQERSPFISEANGESTGMDVTALERKYSQQPNDSHKFMNLEWDSSCYFSDGKRQIDYVLAFENEELDTPSTERTAVFNINCENSEDVSDMNDETDGAHSICSTSTEFSKKHNRRRFYEENLKNMGLELEYVDIAPQLGRTSFVLVHAPFPVLEKQSKVMGVRLPIREIDVHYDGGALEGLLDQALASLKIFDFDESTQKLLSDRDYYTAPYSSERRKDFLNWDKEDILFPNAERSRMVYDLLTRANYDGPHGKSNVKHFGIERLLGNSTYSAAYPLHQEMRHNHEIPAGGERTQREVLLKHWASWKNIFKYQPLDCIKRYFGTKVAFYFTWLGYYTRSLYLAAFAGVVCVAYGLFNITEDVVSNDICGNDGVGSDILLCPQCDRYCDFQRLNNSCVYAKVSYLFDNGATVIFAALMSIWATLFLEGWKRYHAEVAWKWGLLDVVVEEDTVRPEFQFRVKTRRLNPVTQEQEPYLSTRKKVLNFFGSGATVLFFVSLVLAVVFGMVLYRVICMRILAFMDHPTVDSYAFIIVSTTAATINLCVIMIMNMVYNYIAHKLTTWECPRTQSDFDNSYTFKVFLFQFVNYYSSLFYIAFFKGLLSQLPGTRDNEGNVTIGGFRLEGCDAAGCFAELVIQLAIIMCGKQFFSALVESAYPSVMSLLRKWKLRVPVVVETKEQRKQRIREEKAQKTSNMKRWEADYYLNPTYDQFLFDEYLEMVIQFGFVTLFVAAFPLAPLFAVINNILEIRVDAKKFLCVTQRPTPAQAKNIGIWLNILDVISKASVTINALVISFTSDFVPKTMYYLLRGTMIGYVDYSLSYFNSAEYDFSHSQFDDVKQCRYRGYRRTPCSLVSGNLHHGEPCDDRLGLSYEWWKVFAARLLFVVIFEHVVMFIKIVVEYLIPDVPTRIFVQQQRERYLLRQAILGDMSGLNSQRKPTRKQSFADTPRVAFQPGSFDDHMIDDDPEPAQVLFRSRESNSVESFTTALPPNGSSLSLQT
ncbi:unnamed protein product [Auanema sp. JU1783]|nr:unnamed protein product [Auanema sp. JU1783]